MADVMGGYISKTEKDIVITSENEHVAEMVVDTQEPQNNESEETEDKTVTTRRQENERKLEVFKEELAGKREARRKAISAAAEKLALLQRQLNSEQIARINAEQEVTLLKERFSTGGLQEELDRERSKVSLLEKELACERRWQKEFQEEQEKRQEAEQQTHDLKELTSIGREMLRIREREVTELRKRLCEAQYPQELREEYEVQIENAKQLRCLYEAKVEEIRQEQQQQIDEEVSTMRTLESKVRDLEAERKEAELMKEHLKERVIKLDKELEERNDAANVLQEQLDASVTEYRDLTSQVNSVSNLFAHILVGNSCATDSFSNDEQFDENLTLESNNNESGTQNKVLNSIQAEQVWEMLVSHTTQDAPTVEAASSESCYKSVDTPSGKRSVISVSQTYLTLKNLILEKKALVKEVNNLKMFNEHLETRLGNQERRLTTVSSELKKTWGVVNKLRVQHKQLHTQEKILRYELQHKRLLLNDLKEELERCKEIWDMARQKNCESEEEWRKLRKEFADRRTHQDIINNSVESGYEEEEVHSPPTEESTDSDQQLNLVDPLTPDYVDSESEDVSQNTGNEEITSDELGKEIITETQISGPCTIDNTRDNINVIGNQESSSDLLDGRGKDESAENVSKFLEGLIGVDDTKPNEHQEGHSKNSTYSNSTLLTECALNTVGNSCPNDVTTSSCLVAEKNTIADNSTKNTGECSTFINRTTAEVLDARTERLKRLEEQCKLLFNKVTATTIKSNVLSSKLELLHEQYGRSEDDSGDIQPKAHSSKHCDKNTKEGDEESER